MKKEESVWVVVGESESRDNYLAVFGHKPNKTQLTELARNWDYDPDFPGNGYAKSRVYIAVFEEFLR